MCNSSQRNGPLCSVSFVSNFLKNILSLKCVFMIVLVEGLELLKNNLAYMEQAVLHLNVIWLPLFEVF